MGPSTSAQTLAFDTSSLTRLKHSTSRAGGDNKAGVDEAAKQFEALFLNQMLSAMRKASPESGLLGKSAAEKQTQEMLDTQWSQTLADRGIGLADAISRDLSKTGQDGQTGAGTGPKPLGPSESLAQIKAQREAVVASQTISDAPLVKAGQANARLLDLNTSPIATMGDNQSAAITAPSHVAAFVDRLGGPADRASQQTGLSSRLILAQAALETGWGRHETQDAEGQPSHNVFNIKATGWQGESTDVVTHEYDKGQAYATTAGFRVYDSYESAFDDYARLINDSPRYAPARAAGSPEAAAQALQDGGYATDPRYADKLVSVMAALPEVATAASGGLFAQGASAPLIDTGASASRPLIS